ncbi:MAG: hypothetical protein ABI777_09930 [Betaproteobacteria bacterium]
MRTLTHRLRARREDLGLDTRAFASLTALRNPQQIQNFVNAIPANFEADGETVRSVQGVLQHRKAHCIEGAMVAACALWIQGKPPLLMHLDCAVGDYPHVVALFKRGRHWGAVSKSNHAVLRFRDPVYRSLRELAMSYLHEFRDRDGHKTLRSYSAAYDLRSVAVEAWVTGCESCWTLHDHLAARRHFPLVTSAQARALVDADACERKAGLVVDFAPPAI